MKIYKRKGQLKIIVEGYQGLVTLHVTPKGKVFRMGASLDHIDLIKKEFGPPDDHHDGYSMYKDLNHEAILAFIFKHAGEQA